MTPRPRPKPRPCSISRRRSPKRPRSARICAIPIKNYHRMDLAKLDEFTPHFSWDDYFKEIGAPAIKCATSAQLDFFQAVDAALVFRAARRLEDLSALATDSCRRAGAAREVRGGKFQFLRQDAHRRDSRCCRAGNAASSHRPRTRRSSRSILRAAVFPAGSEGQRAGDG